MLMTSFFPLFILALLKDLSFHNHGFEKASNHSSFKTMVSSVLSLQDHGFKKVIHCHKAEFLLKTYFFTFDHKTS